jgi:hypothetical protein
LLSVKKLRSLFLALFDCRMPSLVQKIDHILFPFHSLLSLFWKWQILQVWQFLLYLSSLPPSPPGQCYSSTVMSGVKVTEKPTFSGAPDENIDILLKTYYMFYLFD